MTTSPRGFTLIELLMVIAIISLLTSIVFSQVAIARTKSVDTAKKAELGEMRTAMRSFHLDRGRMPHNYSCTGASCVPDDDRGTLAIEDTENPDNPTTESGRAFRASMLELVNGGYLPEVPKSPGGAGYAYYDYGPGSLAGAIIATSLTSGDASDEGAPGSCRPFTTASGIRNGGGLAALDDWIACPFGEVMVSGRCVTSGDDAPGQGGNNICSDSVSRDFCLCNQY